MSVSELIADAKSKVESGLSRVAFLNPSSRFFTDELFEAWDQIQTAAKLLDEARQQHQRDLRNG